MLSTYHLLDSDSADAFGGCVHNVVCVSGCDGGCSIGGRINNLKPQHINCLLVE